MMQLDLPLFHLFSYQWFISHQETIQIEPAVCSDREGLDLQISVNTNNFPLKLMKAAKFLWAFLCFLWILRRCSTMQPAAQTLRQQSQSSCLASLRVSLQIQKMQTPQWLRRLNGKVIFRQVKVQASVSLRLHLVPIGISQIHPPCSETEASLNGSLRLPRQEDVTQAEEGGKQCTAGVSEDLSVRWALGHRQS